MRNVQTSRAAGKREHFLDLLRIFAGFLVIVNHTSSGVFLDKSPQETAWFVLVVWFFLSKPAVLLFYMISGYLLLGRQDSWGTAWVRIRRILIVIVCCAAAYAVYHGFCNDPNSTPVQMLGEFARLFREPPSNALWYLYTYLALLIMLPFLQKMAALMQKQDYVILFGLAGFFTAVMPILKHYSQALEITWHFELPAISNAVAMLFAGHYFARFGVRKTGKGFCLAAALTAAMVLVNTFATWTEYQRTAGIAYLFFEDRELLPNVIAAVCLFYMASFVKFSARAGKVVSLVGSCIFGMYLIGDIVTDILHPIWDWLGKVMHAVPAVVLFEIVVFLACFVIILPLRWIPWVRKLI